MAEVSEDRLDILEEKIRLKVDTMSGFVDVEGKYRYLENVKPYPNELLRTCSCLIPRRISFQAVRLHVANRKLRVFDVPTLSTSLVVLWLRRLVFQTAFHFCISFS